METVDWNKYKLHCSFLSTLMTTSRSKNDPLSQTAKAGLRDIWIKNIWGRERSDMVGNKNVQKGRTCETDSLELIERVTGKKYFKNQKTLENDWIVGTPDVTGSDLVDIKTSWDLFTFMNATEDQAKKDYFYQVLGYMWLMNVKKATVSYCLVNTPEIIMTRELDRLSYTLPPEEIEQYRNNYIFDDIPEDKRIKSYNF